MGMETWEYRIHPDRDVLYYLRNQHTMRVERVTQPQRDPMDYKVASEYGTLTFTGTGQVWGNVRLKFGELFETSNLPQGDADHSLGEMQVTGLDDGIITMPDGAEIPVERRPYPAEGRNNCVLHNAGYFTLYVQVSCEESGGHTDAQLEDTAVYADGKILWKPDLDGYELTSAVVENEIGKAGTFTFTMPPTHPMYMELKPLKSKITVRQNGATPFRGRVLDCKRNLYGMREVYCEGELSYLVDSIQRPYSYDGYPEELLKQYLWQHNQQVEPEKRFYMGNVTALPEIDPDKIPKPYPSGTSTEYRTIKVATVRAGYSESTPALGTISSGILLSVQAVLSGWYRVAYSRTGLNGEIIPMSGYIRADCVAKVSSTTGGGTPPNPYYLHVSYTDYASTMDAINDNLVGKYGGYLVVRDENGIRYLDYVKDFSEACGQSISFGENMLDLTENITAENVYTVIIPLGDEQNGKRLTIEGAKVDGATYGKDYLENQSGIDLFGRVVRVETFDGVTDPDTLKQLGETALGKSIIEALSLDASAVDMTMMGVDADPIRAGVLVRVVSEAHGLDADMLCSATTTDLLRPDLTRYKLGSTYKTLTDKQNSHGNGENILTAGMMDIASRVGQLEGTNAK